MTDTLRSEWIKLRTIRMNLVLLVIALAFPLIISVLTTSLQNESDINAESLVGLITGTSVVTALLLGVVGATSISGEFAHGTIRATFAATPNRQRVLAAKSILTFVLAITVETIVVLLCYGICSAIASSRDAGITLSDAPGGAPAMVGVVLFAGFVSLLGLGLGMVIRNNAAAVAVLILWPLLLENLLAGLLFVVGVRPPTPWLPFTSGILMADPSTIERDVSRIAGGVYFGSVALAITLIGAVITTRRDA